MKAFITDTHLSVNNIELQLDIFKQAFEYCKLKKISILYHAGDWLDKRSYKQHFSVKEGFESILGMASHYGITIVSIVGNHDKINYESEKSWLSQFKHHPNLTLVEDVDYFDVGECRMHLVSFFDENTTYSKYLNLAIKNIDKTKNNILLTHISITGVKNNDYNIVENNIPIEDFLKFDLTLTGHYHDRQELKNGRIVYFGSAFQANYGEDQEKGLCIVKDDMSIEYRNLKFPKYSKVVIDVDKQSTKEIDSLIKEVEGSGENVRFEFTGSESKLKKIDKNLLNSKGIDVKKKSLIEDNITGDIIIEKMTEDKLKEEFKEFCETEKLDYNKGINYLN